MEITKGEWYKRKHCHLTDLNVVVFPIIKNAKAEPIYRNAIADSKPHAISGILIANAYGKTKEEAEGNAKLIAEAGTVHNETGYSPRELADQKAELLEALKAVQLEVGVLEHNWDYREVEYMPKVINAIQKSTKQQLST